MAIPASTDVLQKHGLVALVGNPNTGKTTLFNALTGYRQRVGNYAGVTVEKKTGFIRSNGDIPKIEIIDLPGAYSLAAHSADEAVVLDVLLGRREHTTTPDLILVVVDATQLARNLFLVSQLLEIGRPVVVALNMVDLAESSGLQIDCEALSAILRAPVLPVVATKQSGIDQVIEAVVGSIDTPAAEDFLSFPDCVTAELDGLHRSITERSTKTDHPASRIELLQALLDPGGHHETSLTQGCGDWVTDELVQRRTRIRDAGESVVEVEARTRYAWIDQLLSRVLKRGKRSGHSRSEAVDRVLTHRLLGLVALAILMGACFQSVYAWSAPLMDTVERSVSVLGAALAALIPAGAVQSLLVDGAVAGVGAVMVFLPQILILFLFIAILEDCGYMARAAFLLDRWMRMLGLTGKSFIPLMSSFACAVPGIMATRTIEDRRDRFITILVAPLMSCSARLPVYILLISAFIPPTQLLGGVIALRAAVLFAVYMIGIVTAVVVTLVLKRTVVKGDPHPFLMVLPSYRWPSPRTVLHRIYEQGRVFCATAGTIIFAMTIVIWALAYYPRPSTIATDHEAMRLEAEQTHQTRLAELADRANLASPGSALADYEPVSSALADIVAREQSFATVVEEYGLEEGSDPWHAARVEANADVASMVENAGGSGEIAKALHEYNVAVADRLTEIDQAEAGAYLQNSILGRMGRWVEPVVKPLGWDWRIGTAAIASFPAREVVIATLGTIYNLGEERGETSTSLRQKLHTAKWPDGRPVFNLAVALSLMVFFALCCQCGATLAVIKRETNSWRWPVFTFSYMTALAYMGAFVTYQIASRLI